MTILCLGLSHHTTPVHLRERINVRAAELQFVLSQFDQIRREHTSSIDELVILSTCNRLELYVSTADACNADDSFAELLTFIEQIGISTVAVEPHLYRYIDTLAAEHLFRVAGGLDSMIVGEAQILGQIAEAFDAARRYLTIGSTLMPLFETALRAGKRARAETAIGHHPISVISVALRLAEQIVGDLSERYALVVGAGEMGRVAVDALLSRHPQAIAIANRTQQRAIDLAARCSGQVYTLDQLAKALSIADVVIVATDAAAPIVDRASIQHALHDRSGRPLVLIDIAVPRNVDPAVSAVHDVHLFNMDDLQAHVRDALSARRDEIPRVEAIIEQEVAAFEVWRREQTIAPVIKDLRNKAETIRQQELERTLHYLPDIDPQTREHIQHLSRSLINKLLHEPTVRLRVEASNGHAAEYVETIRRLFDLEAGQQSEEDSC